HVAAVGCRVIRQANQNIQTTILVLIFGILSIEKGIMYMERSIVGCLCERKLNLIW
ncbi:hypothetical protein BDW66DRAFT_143074, partial [Aspergillus desertorum]